MSSVGSPKKPLPNVGRNIPSRKMVINDVSQLPMDYSTTPGGTLFSTTPGGTRIIYDRNFLMQLRNSPMAKSPPKNLPSIPGVTSPMTGKENKPIGNSKTAVTVTNTTPSVDKPQTAAVSAESGDEPQFHMDI